MVGNTALRMMESEETQAIVYMSDGRYYCLKDVKKDEAVIIPSDKIETKFPYDMLEFSPSGKYVYYFRMFDVDNNTGELWRCEYKKLGNDSSKNEKYCEKIDSNVCRSYFVSDDGVVYNTGSDELKYFNGKNTYYFADTSSFYSIKGEKRIVYKIYDSETDGKLYGIELENPEEKLLLAENVDYCFDVKDFDNIFYQVDSGNEDGKYEHITYVTGFGKEPEKVGVGVDDTFFCNGKTAYQVERNGVEVKNDDLFKVKGDAVSQYVLSKSKDILIEDGTYKTLYAYKDGKCSVISDKVMESTQSGYCLLYMEANQMEVFSLDDLKENIEAMLWNSCMFVYSPSIGKSVQFTYDAYQSIEALGGSASLYSGDLYITETDAMLLFNRELYVANIENEKIQSFTWLAEDVRTVENNSSTIFYKRNYHGEEDISYYSIYEYKNGENNCIAEDSPRGVYGWYEDGVIFAYMGYEKESGYTTVFIDDKDKSYEIYTGEFLSFSRIENMSFLYRSNRGLWMYENGASNFIARDVEGYWCQNSMELTLGE